MMHQFREADGSFSIGSHEPKGMSLLSFLSAKALFPLVYERASHPQILPDLSMDCQSVDDGLLKTPLGEVKLIQN